MHAIVYDQKHDATRRDTISFDFFVLSLEKLQFLCSALNHTKNIIINEDLCAKKAMFIYVSIFIHFVHKYINLTTHVAMYMSFTKVYFFQVWCTLNNHINNFIPTNVNFFFLSRCEF